MPDWPHSPMHRLCEAGAYMVTAGTYRKLPIFHGSDRLDYLCGKLLQLAAEYEWMLQAWAVFPNHYHFVATSPGPQTLRALIQRLHSVAAIEANRWDLTRGRKVFFEYWETHLTYQKSFDARLNYVHCNAVRHGLVSEPSLYRWCSAGWFQRQASTAFYRTIMGMKSDRVCVPDEFVVEQSDIGPA